MGHVSVERCGVRCPPPKLRPPQSTTGPSLALESTVVPPSTRHRALLHLRLLQFARGPPLVPRDPRLPRFSLTLPMGVCTDPLDPTQARGFLPPRRNYSGPASQRHLSHRGAGDRPATSLPPPTPQMDSFFALGPSETQPPLLSGARGNQRPSSSRPRGHGGPLPLAHRLVDGPRHTGVAHQARPDPQPACVRALPACGPAPVSGVPCTLDHMPPAELAHADRGSPTNANAPPPPPPPRVGPPQ